MTIVITLTALVVIALATIQFLRIHGWNGWKLQVRWLDFTPAKDKEEEARRERLRAKSSAVRGLIALLTNELCELARGKQPSGNTVAFIIGQLWLTMDAAEKGCPQPCVESDAEIMRGGGALGKSKGLLSLADTIESLYLYADNPLHRRDLKGLALWLRGELPNG